jgi:ethanolamine utilization protein EutN
MILGRVVGEVWGTRKHPALEGRKLLIIQPHLWYAPSHEVGHLVAVDPVGAGVGEDVVVCLGTPARRALGAVNLPIDAAVQAIVDHVELAPEGQRGARPLAWVDGGPGPAGPSTL